MIRRTTLFESVWYYLTIIEIYRDHSHSSIAVLVWMCSLTPNLSGIWLGTETVETVHKSLALFHLCGFTPQWKQTFKMYRSAGNSLFVWNRIVMWECSQVVTCRKCQIRLNKPLPMPPMCPRELNPGRQPCWFEWPSVQDQRNNNSQPNRDRVNSWISVQ